MRTIAYNNVGAPPLARVDLGLALLQLAQKPGESLTAYDIAAWCDCSKENIFRIERRALAKLRELLREGEKTLAEELSDTAPRKMRLPLRFKNPVIVKPEPEAVREIPLKQWLLEEAARDGVKTTAIHNRLARDPKKAPEMRRVNRRVIFVRVAA